MVKCALTWDPVSSKMNDIDKTALSLRYGYMAKKPKADAKVVVDNTLKSITDTRDINHGDTLRFYITKKKVMIDAVVTVETHTHNNCNWTDKWVTIGARKINVSGYGVRNYTNGPDGYPKLGCSMYSDGTAYIMGKVI